MWCIGSVAGAVAGQGGGHVSGLVDHEDVAGMELGALPQRSAMVRNALPVIVVPVAGSRTDCGSQLVVVAQYKSPTSLSPDVSCLPPIFHEHFPRLP